MPPKPWFETFFAGLYGRVLDHNFSAARSWGQAELIRRLLKLREGQRVLDVPCGRGRIALPLARMGMAVTGVDLQASFIRAAREGAMIAGLRMSFIRQDMRTINFHEEFDAAVNWFGSFGYFSDKQNIEFLRRLHDAVRPGGKVLMEGLNKPWLVRHFRPSAEETIGGVTIRHRHQWDARTSRIRATWTMSAGRRRETVRLNLRLYSPCELRSLLRQAGFVDVRVYGNPPLRPMDLRRPSPRWIVVARRPSCL